MNQSMLSVLSALWPTPTPRAKIETAVIMLHFSYQGWAPKKNLISLLALNDRKNCRNDCVFVHACICMFVKTHMLPEYLSVNSMCSRSHASLFFTYTRNRCSICKMPFLLKLFRPFVWVGVIQFFCFSFLFLFWSRDYSCSYKFGLVMCVLDQGKRAKLGCSVTPRSHADIYRAADVFVLLSSPWQRTYRSPKIPERYQFAVPAGGEWG